MSAASAGFVSKCPVMHAVLVEARAAKATAANALSVSRSSQSVSSVHLVQSQGLETEASLALLRVVRGSFPTAAFDAAGLAELYNGKARISRKFTEAKWPQQLQAARSAFVNATLSQPLPLPSSTSHVLWADTSLPDGSVLKAQYVNPAFDSIEVDCLLKIEVRAGFEWKQDPDVARSSGELSFISASAEASVPHRQAPPLSPVRWRRSSDDSNASTCTAQHYHPLANHYIIGEVYYPLHQGDKSGSRHYNPAVQKLVQLERSLQFLSHKEGKPVGECVAGALLIGPAFNHRVRAQLASELRQFPNRFPCLCALNSRRRVLLLQLPHSSIAAVAAFRDHERVLDELAAFKAAMEGRMADLERRLVLPAARAASVTDPHDALAETSPPVSPGAGASAAAAATNASALLAEPVAADAALLAPTAPTTTRKKRTRKKKPTQSQPAPLALVPTTSAGASIAAASAPAPTGQAAGRADVVVAPSLLENGLAWLWRLLRL